MLMPKVGSLAEPEVLENFTSFTEEKTLENFLLRFPNVFEKIFKELDNQTLTKSREVSKSWKKFLGQSRLIYMRKILKYHKNHVEYMEDWQLVMVKMPLETLKQVAAMVEEFYTRRTLTPRIEFQHSPLQIAADYGSHQIFELFHERIGKRNPNPARKDRATPLYFAAQRGNFEICQLILNSVEDKNPATNKKVTPLHIAAINGHYKICKLIANVLEDKNPKDDTGRTPLHCAAANGHVESFKILAKSVRDLTIEDNQGVTPLSYAIVNNRTDILNIPFGDLAN